MISAPQPAHLRHLGRLALTSDVTGAFSFFLLSLEFTRTQLAQRHERAHTHVSAATRTHANVRAATAKRTSSINLISVYFTHHPPLFICPLAGIIRVVLFYLFFQLLYM